MLQELAKNIWTASVHHSFIGLHVGTRMTVIRLSSGKLLLHSPVALPEQLRSEIDALGPVAHIVCPKPVSPHVCVLSGGHVSTGTAARSSRLATQAPGPAFRRDADGQRSRAGPGGLGVALNRASPPESREVAIGSTRPVRVAQNS